MSSDSSKFDSDNSSATDSDHSQPTLPYLRKVCEMLISTSAMFKSKVDYVVRNISAPVLEEQCLVKQIMTLSNNKLSIYCFLYLR